MDLRLKSGKVGFESSFELAGYIRQLIDGALPKLVPPKSYVLGDVDSFLDFLNCSKNNSPETILKAVQKLPKQHDVRLPIVDALLTILVGITGFTVDSPFLLKDQNDKLKGVLEADKLEISASVFDIACRSIIQSALDDMPTYPLAFAKLKDLKLYNDAKPAMPGAAFQVNSSALKNADVKTHIKALADWFIKYSNKPLVRYNLHRAQIRAWNQYANKRFPKAFSIK
ncbi:hypothetical protein GGR57DRAFT_399271 [Xylariaceae sp. FL1272]|nr:hypothetical protein GGR57DRAFT_399271 [Xylariaceae sp. FL1272]